MNDQDLLLLAAIAACVAVIVGIVACAMVSEVIDLLRGQAREQEDERG